MQIISRHNTEQDYIYMEALAHANNSKTQHRAGLYIWRHWHIQIIARQNTEQDSIYGGTGIFK